MKRISEVSEAKRAELEAEVEMQKRRFIAASRRGMSAVKTDLSVMNWLKSYPRESAVLIMMTGFVAARMIQAKRQKIA